jgi:spermidine synthase
MNLNKKHSFLTTLSSYISPCPIEQRKGQITPFLEVVLESGKLLLNTTLVNYSYGSLHDIFYKTLKKIQIQKKEIKNVLILGFGGGSIASILTDTFHKDCRITGIEADEVVIDLAKKHFNIGRLRNLTIHITDAYDFVLNCKEMFDFIAIDLFIEDETPQKFSDDQFFSALSNLLAPSGIICYNRMLASTKSEKKENELIKTFNQLIGPNSLMKYYSGGRTNWMIIHERALINDNLKI